MIHKIDDFRDKIVAVRGGIAVATLTSSAAILAEKGYFEGINLFWDEF